MLSDSVLIASISSAGVVLAGIAAGIPAYFSYMGMRLANQRLVEVAKVQNAMKTQQSELHVLVNSQTAKLIEVEKAVSLKEGQAEANEKLMAAEKEVSRLGGINAGKMEDMGSP